MCFACLKEGEGEGEGSLGCTKIHCPAGVSLGTIYTGESIFLLLHLCNCSALGLPSIPPCPLLAAAPAPQIGPIASAGYIYPVPVKQSVWGGGRHPESLFCAHGYSWYAVACGMGQLYIFTHAQQACNTDGALVQ